MFEGRPARDACWALLPGKLVASGEPPLRFSLSLSGELHPSQVVSLYHIGEREVNLYGGVPPEGLEPSTCSLRTMRSIQLSHGGTCTHYTVTAYH